MNEMEQKRNVWQLTAVVSLLLLGIVCVIFAVALSSNKTAASKSTDDAGISGEEALSLWNDGARAKTELISYIEAVTDKNGPDYIPPEHRIAVFDMDGTLCCETDPIYFDHMLFMHRVLNDPTYKATEQELKTADKVFEYIDTGKYPDGLDMDHGRGVASSFAGMTLKDFDLYVKEYRDTPTAGYNGMTKGEAFYKPMIQVVDYLNANDFKV